MLYQSVHPQRGESGSLDSQWPLPSVSVPQLVNRLGSVRDGVELCMQGPTLQARERRREHVAVVEGRCSRRRSRPGWICHARGRGWVG